MGKSLFSSRDGLVLRIAARKLKVIVGESFRLQALNLKNNIEFFFDPKPFQLTTCLVPKCFDNQVEVLGLISMSEVPISFGIPSSLNLTLK